MSNVMMLERMGLGTPGMGGPAAAPQIPPLGMPSASNWCVLPRCSIRVEKCAGGIKLTCSCEDKVACAALQNLCRMMAAGTCTLCCTLNGIAVCQCSLTCGFCRCEFTADGVSITCTSGDKKCCELLQACCDCIAACLAAGCCCFVCFNNTPVCCGC